MPKLTKKEKDIVEELSIDLQKEIEKKYKKLIKWGPYPSKYNFGFRFGIEDVFNNYAIRLKQQNDLGLSIGITIDSDYDFFEYLKDKNNITFLEEEIKEILKYSEGNNTHKRIYFDYLIDLNKITDCDRKILLCELSYKATLLMKAVSKLHEKYKTI
ncbi:hypothetical protein [Methanobrevibacter sp.]|uniref:hypothetical protein n=1 Tax=Methanobrevibacter sp. TaxID=66852 RepID=UPI0026314434|nr:hypothetical protein [uncultured Methanobrevibacter sp.]